MFIATQTPRYSIRWEFTPFRNAKGQSKAHVEVIAIHTETGEQSTVCTMNGLVGVLPSYVRVDDMANEWTIPAQSEAFLKDWIRHIHIPSLEAWLDEDRRAGAWSEEHIEQENIT